ncbi:lysylphosphatidylglycerol synthase transmembrane domain-containing protein [Neotabrizicola sp. sgz301269]|uniref:lysylphosphatidylglycerol synthase transmembrane domain-containing protein n=1 Tax=Neotabrizicola sp. sgz301269 TaxID=3276282 RepID=UPI00376FC8D2
MSRLPPRLMLALRAAVTLAALVLAWRISREMTAEGPVFAQLRPVWLLPAFALHALILWGLGLRLRLMLGALGEGARPGLAAMFRLHWQALGVSQVALGTIGGDALRVALLAGPGRTLPQAFRLVLVDRVIGVMGLVLLGGGALLAVLPPEAALRAALVLAVGFFAGLVAIFAIAGREGRFWREPARIATLLRMLVRQPMGWVCLALAMLTHLASAILYLLCAWAIGLAPPVAETLVAVPAGLLVSTIPASLGGWGLREVSIAATYRALGSTFAGAVTVSVLYGLSHVAMALPGLLSLWKRPATGRGR